MFGECHPTRHSGPSGSTSPRADYQKHKRRKRIKLLNVDQPSAVYHRSTFFHRQRSSIVSTMAAATAMTTAVSMLYLLNNALVYGSTATTSGSDTEALPSAGDGHRQIYIAPILRKFSSDVEHEDNYRLRIMEERLVSSYVEEVERDDINQQLSQRLPTNHNSAHSRRKIHNRNDNNLANKLPLHYPQSASSMFDRNAPLAAVICTLVIFLIAATVVGNCMVCLAVLMVRKLKQQPANLLLVSLAVADFSVGLFVMPVALVNVVEDRWILGEAVCRIWTSADLMLCTASILNLCMISVDRYLAVTRALRYAALRTRRRMAAYIAVVWIGALLVSATPLIFPPLRTTIEHFSCQVSQNQLYQIYATIISFYAPCFIMVIVYVQMWRAAKRIQRTDRATLRWSRTHVNGGDSVGGESFTTTDAYGPAPAPPSSRGSFVSWHNNNGGVAPSLLARNGDAAAASKNSNSLSFHNHDNNNNNSNDKVTTMGSKQFPVHHRKRFRHMFSSPLLNVPTNLGTTAEESFAATPAEKKPDEETKTTAVDVAERKARATSPPHSVSGGSASRFKRFHRPSAFFQAVRKPLLNGHLTRNGVAATLGGGSGNRSGGHGGHDSCGEDKARKTLGVIMSVFIICWVPFFILALAKSQYVIHVPKWLDMVALWLGYSNSMLNPLIYCKYNREFRIPFREMLCCRFRTIQVVMRNESFYTKFGPPRIVAELRNIRNKRNQNGTADSSSCNGFASAGVGGPAAGGNPPNANNFSTTAKRNSSPCTIDYLRCSANTTNNDIYTSPLTTTSSVKKKSLKKRKRLFRLSAGRKFLSMSSSPPSSLPT